MTSHSLDTRAVHAGRDDLVDLVDLGVHAVPIDLSTARAEAGISEQLLRLSVGVEDVEDLWVDLDEALACAT